MDKAQLIEDVKKSTRNVCDRLNRAAEAAATKAGAIDDAAACEGLQCMLEVLTNLEGVADYVEEGVTNMGAPKVA